MSEEKGKSAAETPSEEVLKKLFDASMKENPEKLGFTEKESTNFSKAFEDPEFRKMFGDYMTELQDPANRAETEAYIKQLEGEQKVPEGKELIRPTAGFVAKTYKEDKKNAKNGSKGDKVWLNIVQSDCIAKPSSVKKDSGENWSIPYSLGPPHMEKDNEGNNVATFDCCFHPEALVLSKQRTQFQNLLVQTAIEGVEEGFKRQNAPTIILKDYHVIKNVSYKSGVISTMMVDKASKNSWNDTDKDGPVKTIGSTGAKAKAVSGLAEKIAGGKSPANETKKQARTKEEVAAAVAEAKKLQANAPPVAAATVANGKGSKAEPIIKRGFLEGRGGEKAAPKEAKNPLIQEISSTTPATPSKKAATPKKAKPPKTPSKAEEAEATAQAALAQAEKVALQESEREARLDSRSNRQHGTQYKERAVDSSLLNTLNKEQAGVGIGDSASASEKNGGPLEPKYSIIERGVVELGDFELTNNGGGGDSSNSGNRVKNTRPKELVVRIQLPRVAAGQTSQVELDVAEKRLTLKYKNVYSLSFSLPYRVNDKKGVAKFEKVSQSLLVTLPVAQLTEKEVQAQMLAIQRAHAVQVVGAERGNSSPMGKSGSPVISVDVSTPTQGKEQQEKETGAAAAIRKKNTENPYLATVSEEEKKAAASLKEEIALAAIAAKQQAEREANDPNKKIQEAARREILLAEQAAAKAAKKAEEESPIDPSIIFIASKEFIGKKNGYVFKLGDAGMGYYLDSPPITAEEAFSSNVTPGSAKSQSKTTVAAPVSPPPAAAVVLPTLPPFEYRQTSQAITVLVNVPKIDSESVHVNFNATQVQCCFTSESGDKSFAFELLVNSELQKSTDPSYSFDCDRCKFDVAKKNMVLVLVKASVCVSVWECQVEGSSSKEVLHANNWAGIAKPTVVHVPVPVVATDSGSQLNAIDSLIQQANAMKFSSGSAEALFDLD